MHECDYQTILIQALDCLTTLPNDVTIKSKESEEILTNQYLLSVHSPLLRELFSSTDRSHYNIFIPDQSTVAIKAFLEKITHGGIAKIFDFPEEI